MRFLFAALILGVTAARGAGAGEPAARWQTHGSLQASGDVHSSDESAVPSDALIAPAPSSTLAGVLDLGRDGEHGGFKGTLLGVLWDPASADDRGAYGGARARLFRDLSPAWRLAATDDARLQRHAGDASSDFARNELAFELERCLDSGAALGLRVVDRRRSVRTQPDLALSRDSGTLAATLTAGPMTRVRLEGGGERYSARDTSGARIFAAAALARVGARGTLSLRVEAYSARLSRGGTSMAAAVATPAPTATPSGPATTMTPEPTPTFEVPVKTTEGDDGRYLPSEIEPDAPGAAPAYTGPELAVDALFVQPFEEDDDWDFGRSRLGLQLSASRDLGHGWQASGYLHLQHRGGEASEDRLWLRAALRRRLAARWNLVLQGSHLTSRARDADFSRTQGGLGVQFTF